MQPSAERPRQPRAGLLVALLLLAGLGAFAFRGELAGLFGAAGEDADSPEQQLATDPRLAFLLAGCDFPRTYDRDTTDMAAVLAEKLAHGQRDPLKSARGELARLGEAAMPALRRRFERSFSQAFEHAILENVLGTCALMDGPWGVDLMRSGARHPAETVRLAALDGLVVHGGPEDYELALLCFDIASNRTIRGGIAQKMLGLDRERLCAELAGWLERREHPELWHALVPLACAPTDPATVERFRVLGAREDGDLTLRPFLLAAAARDGDQPALDQLRDWLVAEHDPYGRSFALRALARVGLGLEARIVLEHDPLAELREEAALVLAGLGPAETPGEWLTLGLADPDPEVRQACLEALCARGDERSIAEALELLTGTVPMRDAGMSALRKAFDVDPSAADRAFALLVRLIEERADSGATEQVSLLQALSQVPGREPAQILLQLARSIQGEIRGLRAHRWCVHHVYNTGPQGLAVLREELPGERDPLRRIDLIDTLSQEPSVEARALLEGVVLDESRSVEERLFAAYRMVRIGPAEEVAPFLKRVYLASTDARLRPGLHCLLWVWY